MISDLLNFCWSANLSDQVELQLTCEPKPLPIMEINPAMVLVHIFVEKHKVVVLFVKESYN